MVVRSRRPVQLDTGLAMVSQSKLRSAKREQNKQSVVAYLRLVGTLDEDFVTR